MKIITCDNLRSMLMEHTRSTMISIVSMTDPKMLAKDADGNRNPFLLGSKLSDGFTISKIKKSNGNIAGRYDRIVENRLEKQIIRERQAAGLEILQGQALENEVQARFRQGMSWHRPVMAADGPTCLSVNKKDTDEGKAYLRFVFKAAGDAEYIDKENGRAVREDFIARYLAKASDYENQGLDDPVIFVTYALDSIYEIAMDGERYRIEDRLQEHSVAFQEHVAKIADEYVNLQRSMRNV